MKKICVSTFCERSSYGSVMQAIGLKKTFEAFGFESFIIRDCPAPVSNKAFSFVFSKNPKTLIKNLINLRFRKDLQNYYQKSVEFINKNADILYYNDYEALLNNVPEADYYIAGSDQIWHPALCKKAFFLDFVGEHKKRLSYAGSMGVTVVPANKEQEFANLISKMDSISVREKEMVDVIKRYTDKDVMVHIDPSFLIDNKEWRKYSSEYKLNKPYILLFALYWDKKYNAELKKLHRETGYDIVALCPFGVSGVWANKKIYDAGPGQFLYLIDNAQAVVSSSFHGIALSLNFNKKVAAVINPSSPSRINTLLDTLSVKRCAVSDVMSFDLSDYEDINKKIEQEREKSICYLRRILEIE